MWNMTCLQAVLICCLFYLFKLTPIISDPEYLLDQHILICVKSTDADESYGIELLHSLRFIMQMFSLSRTYSFFCCPLPKGEGCVALRAAQICYTEFQITLTHHGEKTGTLTGGIQLQTSEVKPTEKLYGESGNSTLDWTGFSFHTHLWFGPKKSSIYVRLPPTLNRAVVNRLHTVSSVVELARRSQRLCSVSVQCLAAFLWDAAAEPVFFARKH